MALSYIHRAKKYRNINHDDFRDFNAKLIIDVCTIFMNNLAYIRYFYAHHTNSWWRLCHLGTVSHLNLARKNFSNQGIIGVRDKIMSRATIFGLVLWTWPSQIAISSLIWARDNIWKPTEPGYGLKKRLKQFFHQARDKNRSRASFKLSNLLVGKSLKTFQPERNVTYHWIDNRLMSNSNIWIFPQNEL